MKSSISILYEYDYDYIRSMVDSASRIRAKNLHSRFLSINKAGTVEFETESGTTRGTFWIQKVKMLDFAFWHLLRWKDFSDLDKMRMAVLGNLSVTCNCHAFKYWGWAYISTSKKFKFGKPEIRFPKIRNPQLKGSVCKHLETVLTTFPFLAPKLLKEYRKLF